MDNSLKADAGSTALPIIQTKNNVFSLKRIHVFYALFVCVLAFLLMYRLDVYPSPWFDEGAYLNAARTFAEDGVYAEKSSEGYRYNGAVVSVGPTVILPISFVYKIFGASVVAGRLVIVAYGVVTLVALYGLANALVDQRLALVTIVLAIFGWGNQMPLTFRTVMGEMPAFGLLCLGLWLWIAIKQHKLSTLCVVGLMIGLASITKFQIALFALPAMLVAMLLDRVYYRQRGWDFYIIPGVIAGVIFFGWVYYSLYVLGVGDRVPTEDFQQLRSIGIGAYFTLDFRVFSTNLVALTTENGFHGFFIAAFIYVVITHLRRTPEAAQWGLLNVFLLGSIVLYLTSPDLPASNRAAIPIYLLGTVFVARLGYTLTDGYRLPWRDLIRVVRPIRNGTDRAYERSALTLAIMLGVAASLLIVPFVRASFNVAYSGGDAPYQAAQYLTDHEPSDALIETWDKEMAILSDHQYHHPPQIVQAHHNAYIRNFSDQPASAYYDFREHVTADYVVIGPFSRWAQLYDGRLDDYTLVFTASDGTYDVYRKR